MKGEIFNIFESFVSSKFGDETYEAVLEEVADDLQTKEPFVGPQTYPDSDFLLLLSHTLSRVSVALEPALFEFGRFAFPLLASKLPAHVAAFSHPKPFLMSIDQVIHVEVKKIYRDAETPRFAYDDCAPDQLRMFYSSPRKLYALVEGLVQGAAEHFDHPIHVERRVRDADCEFHCSFKTPYHPGDADGG